MSSKTYKKLTPIQHILERPGMYIGSVKKSKEVSFTAEKQDENFKIVTKLTDYSPGFLKIFDEILTNATDHSYRDSSLSYIKVFFNHPEKDMITVVNNGEGIPVEIHQEYGIYIPELIFGNLLTGSNYDDTIERKGAGTNGLGSKCILDSTLLYLFDGAIKMAKDVEIGDKILGDDGSERTVLNTISGFGKMYTISQQYGKDYIVNDNHTLTLLFKGSMTVDISINEFLSLDQSIQKDFYGKRAEPTKWIVNSTPTLDPFLYGLSVVTCNNRIEKDYLFSDVSSRFLVFAGIITKIYKFFPLIHNVLYIPTNSNYIDDFLFLCTHLSLYIKSGPISDTYQIYGNFESIKNILPSSFKSDPFYSYSTGKIYITESDDASYIGFHLDGNKRFVLLDGTVTHNCTNIYSKKFIIETVDSKNKKKYIQTFEDNMSVTLKPKITNSSVKSYTSISFLPDYSKFSMKGLEDDTMSLLQKRVVDCICITNQNVSIYLDSIKLKGKSLEDYVKHYYGYHCIAFEKQKDWEYLVSVNKNDNTMLTNHVSFVNGNYTSNGGKHVDYIFNQIINKLKKLLEEKKKLKDVKLHSIRDKLFLFLKASVVNPSFNSQTKECLVTPSKEFGTQITVSDLFVEKIYKSSIIEEILQLHKIKETLELSKKTDGKKTNKIFILKLEDALWAGTSRSKECTLILTEGDSAKTFAMWGRSIVGPDRYGVFPLKGKLLNPRDASVSQLINNEEINNLKKIIGLKQGIVYTKSNLSELRYNKIMLLVDQDLDGSHIKSLLVNFFHYWWPSLIKLDYLQTLQTPILKAMRGKKVIEFFNEGDYNKWKNTIGIQIKDYQIKYFKGLGTSTKEDAKNTFKRIDELLVDYHYLDKECDNTILLAFNKDKNSKSVEKCSDKRKEWLRNYDKSVYINTKDKRISYQDLINKELIHFSIYDNLRSIPSICDGLKPSQRKILFYMLKHNKTNLIKVAQLSGYVSAETSYHHGEASLQGAIIGMAQDFVGTNNLNLLLSDGNFGSRLSMGKDAASPRYIFTKLSTVTPILFNSSDSNLLTYLNDDGTFIEPEWYLPIIPTVLVNGCEGIGTGYSTFVPTYNPKDIINTLLTIIKSPKNHKLSPLQPYFKGFGGTVEIIDNTSFLTKGKWNRQNDTTIEITEIPIGVGVTGYKEFLESFMESKSKKNFELKDVQNRTKDENTGISFIVEFKTKNDLDSLINSKTLEKDLKLVKTFSTNNMYLFNEKCILTKFDTPLDILLYFYSLRIEYYVKRKEYLTQKLQDELDILENKIRFIREYIKGELDIHKKSKDSIFKLLETRGYLKLENSYDYLLNMPIYVLTLEKIDDLSDKQTKKRNELVYIKQKTPSQLWEIDLNQLLTLL